jgi:cytochrome c peroxidase
MRRFQSAVLGVFLAAGAVTACSATPDAGEQTGETKAGLFTPAPGPFPREGECNFDDPFFDPVRHLFGGDHNTGPDTLKGEPIPTPTNLRTYVKNRKKAAALGKALFWDMQVGSDGIQACASCHFRAGADPRSKNQMQNGGGDNLTSGFDADKGPNDTLKKNQFPFTKFADSTDRHSTRLRDSDDVTSSQGVFLRKFVGVRRGASEDMTQSIPDPQFNVGGVNVRRSEPRNTPTVFNAVFNHRQFWDGRAQSEFNGVSPFGVRDEGAKVLKADSNGNLGWTVIRIDHASLASQAVGPPLSDREMGSVGRTFQDVGQRLVSAKPLRQQKVHDDDSILSDFVDCDGRGLKGTYQDLIEDSFEKKWWDADQIVVKDSSGNTSFAPYPKHRQLRSNEYTMMEWNFSLFFGLAIQEYESLLVTDDSKLDRHFDRIKKGKPGIFNQKELKGLELFDAAACADCHTGPEMTSAVHRTLTRGFENPDENPTFQPPEMIERMITGKCEIAIYDQSFYNIGVRPFTEDLGVGGKDPWGNPLSISEIVTANPASIPSQELLTLPYPSLMSIGRVPPPVQGEKTGNQGAFKMPSLRNVALTAPYFHNGGQRTLREVVEFYNRGGDFHDFVAPNGVRQDSWMDLGIGKLHMTEDEIDALVAFLETTTDPRVVEQSGVFDHPELFVPNGHYGDGNHVQRGPNNEAVTKIVQIKEVGRRGGPLPAGFLEW